jgi:two-component system chemotaxis response regulator CheY
MVDILTDGDDVVLSAENGVVAWERLQAEGADIAVLDVNMPEMGGVELLKLIRADERYKKLPVLVLTVGYLAEDIVRQHDASVTDYLTKPFEVNALPLKLQEMKRRVPGQSN